MALVNQQYSRQIVVKASLGQSAFVGLTWNAKRASGLLKNGVPCLGKLGKCAILRASVRLAREAKWQVIAVAFNWF